MENIHHSLTMYAYNILGSYEDAKDVVQDAYMKISDKAYDDIENKKAYLIRTIINMSINLKKKQQKLVADYKGEWLPEPVATESADCPIIKKEILTYSLMILLEKLNAKQRAVFILKEAFDYNHKEIAAVLDISEENSRRIYSRAKQQLKKPKNGDSAAFPKGFLNKYIEVISNADTKRLEDILKDDIISISDGGGKIAAAIRPITGKLNVIKFIKSTYNKFSSRNKTRFVETTVNYQPALLWYIDDKLFNCQIFEIKNGKISNFYFILNPDKLKSLENKI
jgi:RNA polymerase sigma factor (sigma-70 family)